ncbi:MAG: undecaprenyl-diphosphate phosphatase [Thermoplasmata archaeon]|nr:undecaprenyl-diphosphate phosphatase [Thermoplasmata archaeon]
MDILAALFLGLVQGITEWLPVSSTGHLVLVQGALSISPAESIIFDLSLHAATLFAVVIFLRKELREIASSILAKKDSLDKAGLRSRSLGWLALLATVPAIIAGLILKDYVDEIFNVTATAIALLLTGLILWLAEMPRLKRNRDDINARDALIIGIFQAASIIPGISRSGSTISAGCYLGFNRQLVAVFSFLMSIPIIVAAIAYAVIDGGTQLVIENSLVQIIAASIVALVTGLLALKWLFEIIKKSRLRIFSIYCWALGIIVLAMTAFY